MIETAIKYHELGFKVVPISRGKKSMVRWKHLIGDSKQPLEEVVSFFNSSPTAIAIACTDGLEIIDIDVKNFEDKETYEKYRASICKTELGRKLLEKVLIQKTPSGGYHFVFKSGKAGNNYKIARNSKGEATLETRANGGYFLVHPSPNYEIIQGSFDNLPLISQEERQIFFDCGKEFDVYIPKVKEYKPTGGNSYEGEETPINEFNAKTDTVELLQKHGWTYRNQDQKAVHLIKPHSTDLNSTEGSVMKDSGVFQPFSTSLQYFNSDRTYTAFSIYKILEHGDDFDSAFKQIIKDGFGKQIEPRNPDDTLNAATYFKLHPEQRRVAEKAIKEKVKKEVSEPTSFDEEKRKWLELSNKFKFDPKKKIKNIDIVLKVRGNDGELKDVAGTGMLGWVQGLTGTGKSLITQLWMASALDEGREKMKWVCDLKGGHVAYVDTEHGEFFFDFNNRRTLAMAGLRDSPIFHSYRVVDGSVDEKIQFIRNIIKFNPLIKMIVIDQIADLFNNVNSMEEAVKIRAFLVELREMNIMVVCIIHMTFGEYKKAKGHAGSILMEKGAFGIMVDKESETKEFTCSERKGRFGGFDPVVFTRNEAGFPVEVNSHNTHPYYDLNLFEELKAMRFENKDKFQKHEEGDTLNAKTLNTLQEEELLGHPDPNAPITHKPTETDLDFGFDDLEIKDTTPKNEDEFDKKVRVNKLAMAALDVGFDKPPPPDPNMADDDIPF